MWLKINQEETLIHCYHFSNIYALFANQANIPTRKVFINSFLKGEKQQHTLAESYIPELNKWIMIDLTHDQQYLKKSPNNILNTLEVLQFFSQKNPDNYSSLWKSQLITHDTFKEHFINESLNKKLKDKLYNQHKYFNNTTQLTYKQYSPEYSEFTLY